MKFISVKLGEKIPENVMKMLNKGELKQSHYSINNDVGYLYYIKIDKS